MPDRNDLTRGRIRHGGDDHPEQWPGQTWRDDARPMQGAGTTLATMGVFSWSRRDPRSGERDVAWRDTARDLPHTAGSGVGGGGAVLCLRKLVGPATGHEGWPIDDTSLNRVPADPAPFTSSLWSAQREGPTAETVTTSAGGEPTGPPALTRAAAVDPLRLGWAEQ
ncbi:beta-galactosidase [Salinactinospora qingdaonensis]|uniref:Glycoside hydrolase family 42 N-terminal domain-containing protein n=1 Tax=Salinactinospora qingdaonensis TaxID=702744 RepID=A0ABP7G627_9ACTN